MSGIGNGSGVIRMKHLCLLLYDWVCELFEGFYLAYDSDGVGVDVFAPACDEARRKGFVGLSLDIRRKKGHFLEDLDTRKALRYRSPSVQDSSAASRP